MPGRVLRDCALELTGVLLNMFNISLSPAEVSVCLKMSTITPLPKNSAVKSMNDYHSVALSLTIMKCF